MKLSIIIPSYNSEKYIDILLDSICKQTYDNYEVILVNDGSTDNTLDIVKLYENKNYRIKHINIKNSGPGIARKVGFENSTGDLIFFVDSDDFLPQNDIFEKIINLYNKYNFDMLIFNFISKYMNSEKVNNTFSIQLKDGYIEKDFFQENKIGGALWEKIFLRKKIKEDFFVNANSYEDFYTSYKYIDFCEKFYFTNEIFYYTNRDNGNSLSKKIDSKKINTTISVLKKIKNECSFKIAIDRIIFEYYIWLIWFYLKNIKNISTIDKKSIKNNILELEKLFEIKDIKKRVADYKLYIKYYIYKFQSIFGGV